MSKSARFLQVFERDWLPLIEWHSEIEKREEQGCFTIQTQSFGIVDYFPKANKVFVRHDNGAGDKGWHKNGLQWLKDNKIIIE